jgi:colicin import membrane protein
MSSVTSRLRPYLLSIGLHAALVVVIVLLGVRNWRAESEMPQVMAIEAVAIEADELARLTRRAPPKKQEPEPAPEPQPEPTPASTPTPEPKKPEPPKPKPVESAKREKEAQARKEAQLLKETQSRQEAQRLKDAQLKAERERLEEQARREAEARRMKEELDAEDRRRRDDARVRAEREAALQRELSEEIAATEAAEARRAAAARAASLSAQWAAAIQARVQRAWIRPPSAQAGLDCRVAVTQAAGGTVIRAEVKECNGDEAVRQSLEAAVFRASPLPPPPEPSLFERNIELRFRPND